MRTLASLHPHLSATCGSASSQNVSLVYVRRPGPLLAPCFALPFLFSWHVSPPNARQHA